MGVRRQPSERLEKRLARVAREQSLDQERLRRWVSFTAFCGVLERAVTERILESYYLKGGVALELRYATQVRATRDLDLVLDGGRDRLEMLRLAVALGFHDFTFRLKAKTTRVLELAGTVRVEVAVDYQTRPWQTIEIDLGPARASHVDFVDPVVRGLVDLDLPVTSPVRCLGLAEQVAQKLHACTGPHSAGRARDVVDILLIESLGGIDDVAAAAAARRVFAERATHAFPPEFTMRGEWRPEIEALATQLGFARPGASELEHGLRALIQRLAAA